MGNRANTFSWNCMFPWENSIRAQTYPYHSSRAKISSKVPNGGQHRKNQFEVKNIDHKTSYIDVHPGFINQKPSHIGKISQPKDTLKGSYIQIRQVGNIGTSQMQVNNDLQIQKANIPGLKSQNIRQSQAFNIPQAKLQTDKIHLQQVKIQGGKIDLPNSRQNTGKIHLDNMEPLSRSALRINPQRLENQKQPQLGFKGMTPQSHAGQMQVKPLGQVHGQQIHLRGGYQSRQHLNVNKGNSYKKPKVSIIPNAQFKSLRINQRNPNFRQVFRHNQFYIGNGNVRRAPQMFPRRCGPRAFK